MNTFKELLGTDDKKKQFERIKELLLIEATPEITLQIRYDGITDDIAMDMSGGNVAFDVIHHILELASIAMRKEELKVALAASKNGDVDLKE